MMASPSSLRNRIESFQTVYGETNQMIDILRRKIYSIPSSSSRLTISEGVDPCNIDPCSLSGTLMFFAKKIDNQIMLVPNKGLWVSDFNEEVEIPSKNSEEESAFFRKYFYQRLVEGGPEPKFVGTNWQMVVLYIKQLATPKQSPNKRKRFAQLNAYLTSTVPVDKMDMALFKVFEASPNQVPPLDANETIKEGWSITLKALLVANSESTYQTEEEKINVLKPLLERMGRLFSNGYVNRSEASRHSIRGREETTESASENLVDEHTESPTN